MERGRDRYRGRGREREKVKKDIGDEYGIACAREGGRK